MDYNDEFEMIAAFGASSPNEETNQFEHFIITLVGHNCEDRKNIEKFKNFATKELNLPVVNLLPGKEIEHNPNSDGRPYLLVHEDGSSVIILENPEYIIPVFEKLCNELYMPIEVGAVTGPWAYPPFYSGDEKRIKEYINLILKEDLDSSSEYLKKYGKQLIKSGICSESELKELIEHNNIQDEKIKSKSHLKTLEIESGYDYFKDALKSNYVAEISYLAAVNRSNDNDKSLEYKGIACRLLNTRISEDLINDMLGIPGCDYSDHEARAKLEQEADAYYLSNKTLGTMFVIKDPSKIDEIASFLVDNFNIRVKVCDYEIIRPDGMSVHSTFKELKAPYRESYTKEIVKQASEIIKQFSEGTILYTGMKIDTKNYENKYGKALKDLKKKLDERIKS